jgi:hypothetical protein
VTRFSSLLVLPAALVGLSAAAAMAADSVALVEDVSGTSAGVEFMDYVAAGREIRLGAEDRLVLDYLRSCWRERRSPAAR